MKTRVAAFFIVIALSTGLVLASTGCAGDTAKANDSISAANASLSAAMSKSNDAVNLITQAMDQATNGQADQEVATLKQVQTLENQVKSDFSSARAQLSDAAGMKVDDTVHNYLNAKIKAVDGSIAVADNNLAIVALLLSDPSMTANPDTLTKLAELQGKETQLTTAAQAAEDEASRIQSENPGEFQK